MKNIVNFVQKTKIPNLTTYLVKITSKNLESISNKEYYIK